MLLRHRRPADHGADSFTRVDINADISIAPLTEQMEGRFYSYDHRSHAEAWNDGRREDALVRFADRVKRVVQPFGFVEAFKADAPRASAEVELRQLVETQDRDIAPEYAVFAANGVEAFSLFTGYTDEEGGWHDIEDDFFDADADSDDADDRIDLALEAADRLQSESLAQTLDARAENFLREADRQRWYSSRPRVAYFFATDDGKRGIAPKRNHPWSEDDLRAALKAAPPLEVILEAEQRRDDPAWPAKRASEGLNALLSLAERREAEARQAVNAWLDSLSDDEQRAALDLLDADEHRRTEEGDTYAPNEGCVQCESSILKMLLAVGLGVSLDLTDSPEACGMCRGSGLNVHTIGFDGVAAPEPYGYGSWQEHDGASLWFARSLMFRTFGTSASPRRG